MRRSPRSQPATSERSSKVELRCRVEEPQGFRPKPNSIRFLRDGGAECCAAKIPWAYPRSSNDGAAQVPRVRTIKTSKTYWMITAFATFPRVVVYGKVVWSLTTDAIAIRHSRGIGHAASARGWYQGSCCTRSVSPPTVVSVREEECESRLATRDLMQAHTGVTQHDAYPRRQHVLYAHALHARAS